MSVPPIPPKKKEKNVHEIIGIKQARIIQNLTVENDMLRSDLFAAHNVCNTQQRRIKSLLCKLDRNVINSHNAEAKVVSMEKQLNISISKALNQLQDQIELNKEQHLQIEALKLSNSELNDLVTSLESTLKNWTDAKQYEDVQRSKSVIDMRNLVEYREEQVQSLQKDLQVYRRENKKLRRNSTEQIVDVAVLKTRVNRRHANKQSVQQKQLTRSGSIARAFKRTFSR